MRTFAFRQFFTVFSIFILLTAPLAVKAQENDKFVVGRFTALEGEVDLISRKGQNRRVGQIGGAVYESDRIRTGSNSVAKIALLDTSRLEIQGSSVVNVKALSERKGKNRSLLPISVRMLYGKLRLKVEAGNYRQKNFYVKTPTMVAAVRGTDFACVASLQSARLAVFQGKVEVGNRAQRYKKSYLLSARQEIIVPENANPTERRFLPERLLENYLEHYIIKNDSTIQQRFREPETFIDRLLKKR